MDAQPVRFLRRQPRMPLLAIAGDKDYNDFEEKEVKARGNQMKELQQIPGIGPKMAATLVSLGINTVADLRDKNPQELYERLNRITGQRQDPCVLYTFRCAVYYATEPNPDPEKLKWWNWKNG